MFLHQLVAIICIDISEGQRVPMLARLLAHGLKEKTTAKDSWGERGWKTKRFSPETQLLTMDSKWSLSSFDLSSATNWSATVSRQKYCHDIDVQL